MRVAFVYGNPGHHVEMMLPVMRALVARGASADAVSLAELRGLITVPLPGFTVRRGLPMRLRRGPAVGAGFGVTAVGASARVRRTAQRAVWTALGLRLGALLRGADVVVLPNDAAYPYGPLAAMLRRRGVPFVLMQEGIRFPLPGVAAADAYGAGGAAAICAWGAASAAYFRAQGAPAATIHVTGSPRLAGIDRARWCAEGVALRTRLGMTTEPLLYLSNPVDDQGFCSTAGKLGRFVEVLDAAAPALAVADAQVLVKLHPREDPTAFRAAAARSAAAARTLVVEDAPLHAVLGAGRAAIVLASTVGLEALLFELPLGVVELPGHGYVFDYVERDAAIALPAGRELAGRLAELIARPRAAAPPGYLEHHLAHRDDAVARTADVIRAVAR